MVYLQVPTGLRGQALLQVWGRGGRAEEGPLFHNQTSVTVDGRGASVFIQTDKPVYKPRHRGGQLAQAAGGGGPATPGAATRLSPSLPVLISIFTVTPNLRPVSQKVRSASKTLCLEHTGPGPPGQGHRQQLGFLPCSFQIRPPFWVLSWGSESPGEPGGGLWDRGRPEHGWAGGACSEGWGPAGAVLTACLSVCLLQLEAYILVSGVQPRPL